MTISVTKDYSHARERTHSARYYDISQPLVDKNYLDLRLGERSQITSARPLPPDVRLFASSLFAIPGVVDVKLYEHSVTVLIGPEAVWFRVEPRVIRAIRRHLGWQDNIEVTYHDQQS